ncbi:hypothetical protein [Enterococcus sp. HY326]|uniref:hypothetical protein n=1 Tax=Enterococcus sp. HY326 TaxID=2971265 RepID=UPI00223EE65F|nr:hypothetical protein [Enterococcus sp. HY326]
MDYHVVEAKHQGFAEEWETFFFPVIEFQSKEDVINEFNEVERQTISKFSYNHSNPYTAYEYEGELFYEIKYIGIKTEEEMNELGINLN